MVYMSRENDLEIILTSKICYGSDQCGVKIKYWNWFIIQDMQEAQDTI